MKKEYGGRKGSTKGRRNYHQAAQSAAVTADPPPGAALTDQRDTLQGITGKPLRFNHIPAAGNPLTAPGVCDGIADPLSYTVVTSKGAIVK